MCLTRMHSFSESSDQGAQWLFGDERYRLPRANPPGSALVGVRPSSALPSHQKGEDPYLAGHYSAKRSEFFLVGVFTNGPVADDAANPSFFVSFSGRGFGRLQPRDWPSLGNNPPTSLP